MSALDLTCSCLHVRNRNRVWLRRNKFDEERASVTPHCRSYLAYCVFLTFPRFRGKLAAGKLVNVYACVSFTTICESPAVHMFPPGLKSLLTGPGVPHAFLIFHTSRTRASHRTRMRKISRDDMLKFTIDQRPAKHIAMQYST